MKFNDPRPEFRYALGYAMFRYRWLFRLYPEDFAQTISLAASEHPVIGKGLKRTVSSLVQRMARDHGFYKPTVEGKKVWLQSRNLQPADSTITSAARVWATNPECGTAASYQRGCKCRECKDAAAQVTRATTRRKARREVSA